MIKEEVYSFILYYMRKIEKSREVSFNKLNKVLILTIYYSIFEYKYDEFFKENSYTKENFEEFINNFTIISEDAKENKDIYIEGNKFNAQSKFVKLEEEVIESNKVINEVKEIIEKKEQKNIEKLYKDEEPPMERNKKIKKLNYNSLIYKHIFNDIKIIPEAKAEIKKNNEPYNIDKNLSIERYVDDKNLLEEKVMKVPEKIGQVIIKEILYGKVKFPKPILGVINSKSHIIIKNLELIKSCKEEYGGEANLIYSGVIRVTLEYLNADRIYCKDIEAHPRYYLTYIPFEGVKKVIIEDEEFKKLKFIGNKVFFDVNSLEYGINTSLKEEKVINQYAKVYYECEVFVVIENAIYLLMNKVIKAGI